MKRVTLLSLSSLIDAACELEIERIILPFLETFYVTDSQQWNDVFRRLGEFDERLGQMEYYYY